MSNGNESDRVLRFLFGLVCGVVLTILYVRFGFPLPGLIGLEQQLISKSVVKTAETDLLNPHADIKVRQRALAVVLANEPETFVEIDSAIGNQFMSEYLKRNNTNPYQIAIPSPTVNDIMPSLEQLVQQTKSKPIGGGLVLDKSNNIMLPSRGESEIDLRAKYRDASDETIQFLLKHPELRPTPSLSSRASTATNHR